MSSRNHLSLFLLLHLAACCIAQEAKPTGGYIFDGGITNVYPSNLPKYTITPNQSLNIVIDCGGNEYATSIQDSITLIIDNANAIWQDAHFMVPPSTMADAVDTISVPQLGLVEGVHTLSLFAQGQIQQTVALFVVSATSVANQSVVATIFKIYPSPIKQSFSIETEQKGTLRFYDLQGRQVIEYKIIDAGTTSLELPSNSPQGIFIAVFDDGSSREICKVIFNP